MNIYIRLAFGSAVTSILLYVVYRRRKKSVPTLSRVFDQYFSVSEDRCCLFENPYSSVDPVVGVDTFTLPSPSFSQCRPIRVVEPLAARDCTEKVYPAADLVTSERFPDIYQDMSVSEVSVSIVPFDRASVGSASGSDALTPDSNEIPSSPEPQSTINLPPGGFNDPLNDIYEDLPEELNGTMLPKVLIPSDMWAEAVDKDVWHESFCIPAHMGGVLIGRLGKNVRQLKAVWDADFSLNTYPGRQDTLIIKLSCPVRHKDDVLRWVSTRFRSRPSKTPIGNPDQLKRYLPLGEPVPVHVRSLYASKEFFVTIQDEHYTDYLKMQAELDEDYAEKSSFRMQLCEPVTSGTVAIVPHSQGHARALIISVYSTWPKTVFYFLLDHGTFGVVDLTKIRKIRAKYMQIPFQAIHVSWAHAFPVFSDIPDIHVLRTFFSSGRVHAFGVRMETCCRAAVAFSEPYPHPYSSQGLLDTLVSACNSGLYMAIPTAIYPNRQTWLNGSNIPYYPFTYSVIDYPSLVSFIPDGSYPAQGDQTSIGSQISNQESQYNGHDQLNKNQNKNRGSIRGTPTSSCRRPLIFHSRLGRGSSRLPANVYQKENQTVNSGSNDVGLVDAEEPKRKPLGNRNLRGSGGNFGRVSFNVRSRGGSVKSRS